MTNIYDPEKHAYNAFDTEAPDGMAKEIVAFIVWNELLEDVLTSEACEQRMVEAERAIRERFFTPNSPICVTETKENT